MQMQAIIKGSISVMLAAIAAYFEQIDGALVVLIGVMALDYLTGLLKAYLTASLSSKRGMQGILKKLGYFAVVAAGAGCDWVIGEALGQLGIGYGAPFLAALLIAVWLIVNELISILENLSAIGVPMPAFLMDLARRLAEQVEEAGGTGSKEEQDENEGK